MTFVVLAVIAAIIVLAAGVRMAFEDGDDVMAFMGILGAALAGVVVLLIGLIISVFVPHTFSTTNKEILALQDGNSTTGSFFLGSGYIEGEAHYSYYIKEGTGAMLQTESADGITVYQDTDKPYLVQQTGCTTNVEWLVGCVSDGRVTEIHVPKGTILNNLIWTQNR